MHESGSLLICGYSAALFTEETRAPSPHEITDYTLNASGELTRELEEETREMKERKTNKRTDRGPAVITDVTEDINGQRAMDGPLIYRLQLQMCSEGSDSSRSLQIWIIIAILLYGLWIIIAILYYMDYYIHIILYGLG